MGVKVDVSDMLSVFAYLPPGNPVKVVVTEDLDGRERKAVVWKYWDRDAGIRYAQFALDGERAEYLGDTFPECLDK